MQQLKSTGQDFFESMKQCQGRLWTTACWICALQPHSHHCKHWILTLTLQNFTEVCVFFLVFTAHEVSKVQSCCRRKYGPQHQRAPVPGMPLGTAAGQPEVPNKGWLLLPVYGKSKALWQVAAVLSGVWAGLPVHEKLIHSSMNYTSTRMRVLIHSMRITGALSEIPRCFSNLKLLPEKQS